MPTAKAKTLLGKALASASKENDPRIKPLAAQLTRSRRPGLLASAVIELE